MKTAILTLAFAATATFAHADVVLTVASEPNTTYTIVDIDASSAGSREVIFKTEGEGATVWARALVSCVPLQSGNLDTGAEQADVAGEGGETLLEDIERGTGRHAVATYTCEHDNA